MTNRIPQEQIEADKLLCDILRGTMGQVPIDVHLKYILALEEAYKEIERLQLIEMKVKCLAISHPHLAQKGTRTNPSHPSI